MAQSSTDRNNLPPLAILATPPDPKEDATLVRARNVAQRMRDMDCTIIRASAEVFESGKAFGKVEEKHRVRNLYPHLKKPKGITAPIRKVFRVVFGTRKKGIQVQ